MSIGDEPGSFRNLSGNVQTLLWMRIVETRAKIDADTDGDLWSGWFVPGCQGNNREISAATGRVMGD
jgi:hypothetical protein